MALTTDKEQNIIKVTGDTNTSTEVFADLVFIKHVYWYNPTTAGHLLAIKDKNGKDIILMRCESNNQSQVWPIITKVNGIYIDDMDSGTLYIYTI